MNKLKRLLSAIFFSAVAVVVTYLINFWLTPYITDNIGQEAYGFISLARQFTSYVSILVIALNSFASRHITVAHHEGKTDLAKQYYSTVFIANAVLVSVIGIVSAVFVFKLDDIINIPLELVYDVKVLFGLTFLSFCVTTLGNVFSVFAYVKDRLDLTGIIKTVSYIVEAAVIFLLIRYAVPHVWFSGVGVLIAAIIMMIFNIIMARRLMNEYQIQLKLFSLTAVKKLVLDGMWNAFNSLGNLLNHGLDLIVTNLMLNNLWLSQVSVAKTINNIFVTLFSMITQPFYPMMLQNYANHDKEGLLNSLKLASRSCSLLINFAFAGFVAFGKDYYILWIPNLDTEFIYKLTVLTICSAVFEGAVYPLYYIYTLTVKKKIPCIITVLTGLFNVLGMYLLLSFTNLGAYAVVLTTAVIMIFVSVVTNPIYMAHCLKLKWSTFYPLIGRNTLGCIAMVIVCCAISNMATINSWGTFLMWCCIASMCALPVGIIITFERADFKRLVDVLKRGGSKGE